MGAFGNYYYNPKLEIDFSQLKTVSVITNFNAEGRFKPEYFRVINPDQSETTFKIDTVKFTREYDNRILFCCVYTNNRRQCEIILIFYVLECCWVIV